jgi:hypothetical protein
VDPGDYPRGCPLSNVLLLPKFLPDQMVEKDEMSMASIDHGLDKIEFTG